jgi:hypothetical protein
VATLIEKTIGSTGDYSTLYLWADALPADLTAATGTDELWRGVLLSEEHPMTAKLSINGITTDADCYIELTAAAGGSFCDYPNVPLTYSTNYARISGNLTFETGGQLDIFPDYSRFNRIQFSMQLYYSRSLRIRGNYASAERNVFRSHDAGGTGNSAYDNVNSSDGIYQTWINNVFIDETTVGTQAFRATAANHTIHHNLFVRPSSLSVGGNGMNPGYIRVAIHNNSYWNLTTPMYAAGNNGNWLLPTNNAMDTTQANASNRNLSTDNLYELTFADQFNSTINDFRLKNGNDVVYEGLDVTSLVPFDIYGATRSSISPTIGVEQYFVPITLSGGNVISTDLTAVVASVTSDTSGGTLYYVSQLSSAAAPTAAQIKLGNNSADVAAEQSGSIS